MGAKKRPVGLTFEETIRWHLSNSYTLTSNGCMERTVGRDKDGYALFNWGGRTYRFNRAMFIEVMDISLDPLTVIRHRCDNPPCINPIHLEPGTHADNIQDRDTRGRTASGARHYATKVGLAKAREMRRLRQKGCTVNELMLRYQVSETTVRGVLDGSRWPERRF